MGSHHIAHDAQVGVSLLLSMAQHRFPPVHQSEVHILDEYGYDWDVVRYGSVDLLEACLGAEEGFGDQDNQNLGQFAVFLEGLVVQVVQEALPV